MSLPQVLGPINSGDSFVFVSIQNGVQYVLNGANFNSGIVYYWESNVSTIINSNNIPVFTVNGNLDSLLLKDNTNGGTMSFRSDGTTIGNSITASNISMKQFQFSDWNSPVLFLSKAVYTLYNPSGEIANVLTQIPSESNNVIPADNLIVLPIYWFFNCTSTKYNYFNNPKDSILNWICFSNPDINICRTISLVKSAWTNLSDCSIGNVYSYCPSGQLCNYNSCKGPCPVTHENCNYNANNNNFQCDFDSEKYFNDTKWYLSPYFIIFVVGLIIVVIVCIIIIVGVFIYQNRKK